MNGIWKCIAGGVVAVLLALVLEKRSAHMALTLTLSALTMVMLSAGAFLSPVVTFMKQLGAMTQGAGESMEALLKAMGLSMVCKLASLLCADAGYSALGRGIEAAGVCAVLALGVPVFSGLMELLGQTVGLG